MTATPPRRIAAWFRNLHLFWKLLLPFLMLMLLIGISGAFFIVRDLSDRARAELNQDLLRRSVDVEILLRDHELYLVESVRYAANLQSLPEAVRAKDPNATRDLLKSVLALRTSLNLLVVTEQEGRGLVEMSRDPQTGSQFVVSRGRDWKQAPFVADVLRGVVDQAGDKRTGLLRSGRETLLATAGPIRSPNVVGAAIVAVRIDTIAAQASERLDGASVRLFDDSGALIASAGPVVEGPGLRPGRHTRRTERAGEVEVSTIYAPLEARGTRIGTVAVSLPLKPAFASVRGTGLRLVLILAVAMALAVAGLGVLLSRYVLAQVRRLLEANRAFGSGDLSARASVLGEDEVGELAGGFNQMAEQLQASYQELEMRVAQRTEELQRLYQEVSRASEARSEFFTAMSHDFRTPLFAITGHAELMLDPAFAPKTKKEVMEYAESVAEYATTIKSSADYLLELVNSIVDLAKFESGNMEVHTEEIRLSEYVAAVHSTIEPLARRSELTLTFDVAEALPSVSADPTRLREILLNLISNAIKYTPAGGRIVVTAVPRDGFLEISVADTGVGIPRDARTRVFEPFYQVKGTKAQRGQASSGLGLAVTKRLVEAHGGRISFESEVGRGTTFKFSLPLAGSKPPPRKRPRKQSAQGVLLEHQ